MLKHTHASSDSQSRQSTLHSYPCCLAWCGTAALEPRHCHDLSDRWGLGVFIPFPFLPNGCLPLLPHSSSSKTERSLSLSFPPLVTLSPQANPLISPSILERKGLKTRLESSSIDFSTQKSTWFIFWPVVVFVTLGAWLLAS